MSAMVDRWKLRGTMMLYTHYFASRIGDLWVYVIVIITGELGPSGALGM